MTSTAQAASRKRFHLFRHKSTDLQKGKQSATTIPSNGASAGSAFVLPRPRPRPQKHLPFDPLELDYRLELYQKQQDLLAAKSEHRVAKRTSGDDASLEERNDSGNYSEDKQEMASVDESEEEEEEEEEMEMAVAGKEKEGRVISTSEQSEQDKRTETVIRLMGRPRLEQRPSSSHRVRRNQPGTYFPKYAARQFAATTNTMSAEQPTVTRKSVSSSKSEDDNNDSIATVAAAAAAASNVPMTPKQTANDDDNNRPISRSGPSSNVDPDVLKARRRSAMLPSTHLTSPMAPRTTRPRPLSVAALDTLNFWDGGAVCVNPYMPCHEEEEQQQQQQQSELVDYTVTTPGAGVAPSSSSSFPFAPATAGGVNSTAKAGAHAHAHAHHRPSLAPHLNDPHNRNDWSQASQCGEGAYTRHNILHLHSIWRKEKYGASGAGGGAAASHGSQQRRQDAGVGGGDAKTVHRQRNALPSQTMIADAVRVLEERERRKSHPLAFLRRHL